MLLESRVETLYSDDYGTYLTKCFGVASFTILIWDHLITFSDEVEYIWNGRKRLFVLLFFLNRYLIPLSFIVNLYAYFHNSWTNEAGDSFEHSCSRFVRYEGALTMVGIAIVQLMLFMRIHAFYPRNYYVQVPVFLIFMTFVAINSWLLTFGQAVPHINPELHSCSMIFGKGASGPMASASAWLPLLYDTVVLILTLFRTIRPVWHKDTTASQILVVLLKEGIMYYSAIFSVTLILTVMLLRAGLSVRNITAQLELLLSVTMMSRITLHLRRFAHVHQNSNEVTAPPSCPPPDAEVSCAGIPPPRPALSIGRRSRSAAFTDDSSFFAMVTMSSTIDLGPEHTGGAAGTVDRASMRAMASAGSVGSVGSSSIRVVSRFEPDRPAAGERPWSTGRGRRGRGVRRDGDRQAYEMDDMV